MNGRNVQRAAAVVAGIVLSRGADLDAWDVVLVCAVAVAGGLGWWIDRAETALNKSEPIKSGAMA